jgi:formylmethanofuran dehydrogenase subunit E
MEIQQVLKRANEGGYLIAQIQAVHTHTCPFWRLGTRHGPCKCGAEDLLARYKTAQGAADPFSGIKPF